MNSLLLELIKNIQYYVLNSQKLLHSDSTPSNIIIQDDWSLVIKNLQSTILNIRATAKIRTTNRCQRSIDLTIIVIPNEIGISLACI